MNSSTSLSSLLVPFGASGSNLSTQNIASELGCTLSQPPSLFRIEAHKLPVLDPVPTQAVGITSSTSVAAFVAERQKATGFFFRGDENRQRAKQACIPCRRSKVKVSRTL
jgi:hypothetical protein